MTLQLSKRPGSSWRVKSNAYIRDNDIQQFGHSVKAAERDKAWFVNHFATALFHGHCTARQSPEVMGNFNALFIGRDQRRVLFAPKVERLQLSCQLW